MVSMRCVNCADTLQDFGKVTDAGELAHIKQHMEKHIRLGSYRRCTHEGCRRFQRLGDQNDGGSFPEPESKE